MKHGRDRLAIGPISTFVGRGVPLSIVSVYYRLAARFMWEEIGLASINGFRSRTTEQRITTTLHIREFPPGPPYPILGDGGRTGPTLR